MWAWLAIVADLADDGQSAPAPCQRPGARPTPARLALSIRLLLAVLSRW
jgi:hypothetical protein